MTVDTLLFKQVHTNDPGVIGVEFMDVAVPNTACSNVMPLMWMQCPTTKLGAQ